MCSADLKRAIGATHILIPEGIPPGLNRAGTHRVQYLQRWHQVTRRVKGDSELAVGEFGHALAHLFGGTVAGIETSGIERGHPPSNLAWPVRLCW